MILYLADRGLNILAVASSSSVDGYLVNNDECVQDVETATTTLSFDLVYPKSKRLEAENAASAGNYVLRRNREKYEFYTIIDTEHDTNDSFVHVYCEDAGMDLLNENVNPFTATELHNPTWYVEKTVMNCGFEVQTDELSEEMLVLSWDDSTTAMERLQSIAEAFKAELEFDFLIEGLVLRKKYVNIRKKRGEDNGVQWQIGKEIGNIVTKKSISNIATALRVYGSEPENDSQAASGTSTTVDNPNNVQIRYSYTESEPARKDRSDGLYVNETKLLVTLEACRTATGSAISSSGTYSIRIGSETHTVATSFSLPGASSESELNRWYTIGYKIVGIGHDTSGNATVTIGASITGASSSFNCTLETLSVRLKTIVQPTNLIGYVYDDGEDFYVDSEGKLVSRKALSKWNRYRVGLANDEGHIIQDFTYDTLSQGELLLAALDYLKVRCDVDVNYEVTILGSLPDDVNLGDTVYIVDPEGELYLSARLLQIKEHESQKNVEATLGDFLIKDSGISEQVAKLAEDFQKLAQQRQLYTWIVYADDIHGNGISLDSTGKTYIGIAYNKLSATPNLSDPSAYTFTKIVGKDARDGTTRMWIALNDPYVTPLGNQWVFQYADLYEGDLYEAIVGDVIFYDGFYYLVTDIVTEGANAGIWCGRRTDVNGATGQPGADAVSIYSTTVTYGKSNSSSTFPTTWYNDIPTDLVDGEYLWVRTIVDYMAEDKQDTVSYSYAKQGDSNDHGVATVDVTIVSIEYQEGTSATTPPTGEWSLDPAVAALFATTALKGRYLWTKTTFSDESVAYGICYQGAKGDKGDTGPTGKGIVSFTIQYYLSTSTAAAIDGSWSDTIPEFEDGKFYWRRTKIVWTDGTTTYSTPIYDASMTKSNQDALDAKMRATSALIQAGQYNISPFFEERPLTESNYYLELGLEKGEITELNDGWIHIHIDNSPDDTSWSQVVTFASSKHIGASKDYTFLIELRNNASTGYAEDSRIYITDNSNSQFNGTSIKKNISGGSVNDSSVNLIDQCIPGSTDIYEKRFVKTSVSGAANKTALCSIDFQCGALSILDYDIRISLYDDEYTGAYKYFMGNIEGKIKYTEAVKAFVESSQSEYDSYDADVQSLISKGIIGGNIIVGTSKGYLRARPKVKFDITYPILFAGSDIPKGSYGYNNWSSIGGITVRNNISGNPSLDTYKTVYLQGDLSTSGREFTISDKVITLAPTTDDGYEYIPIGVTGEKNWVINFEGGTQRPWKYYILSMDPTNPDAVITEGFMPVEIGQNLTMQYSHQSYVSATNNSIETISEWKAEIDKNTAKSESLEEDINAILDALEGKTVMIRNRTIDAATAIGFARDSYNEMLGWYTTASALLKSDGFHVATYNSTTESVLRGDALLFVNSSGTQIMNITTSNSYLRNLTVAGDYFDMFSSHVVSGNRVEFSTMVSSYTSTSTTKGIEFFWKG